MRPPRLSSWLALACSALFVGVFWGVIWHDWWPILLGPLWLAMSAIYLCQDRIDERGGRQR